MSNLFGKAPKPAAAVPMPVPDDAAALAAQQRQQQQIAARSGRKDTIMTQRRPSGRGDAGTSSYTNSYLGSAV
jgi:hypothetical protein